MIVSIVSSENVEGLWHLVAGFLQIAVDKAYGELTLADAKAACLSGDMQLWVVFTQEAAFLGAAVTQVVEYPQLRAMRIVLLGGKKFDEWKALLDATLAEAARKIGCNRMEAFGRTGFVRSLQGVGYVKLYTAIGRSL